MKRNRDAWRFCCLVLMLVVAFILGMRYGTAHMPWLDFWRALLMPGSTTTDATILYSLRLPRCLAAVVAGVGLSLSGVLLQTVTDNELAAPNIIGVNAGAGFGVALLLVLCPAALWLTAPVAFLGASLTALVIVGFCVCTGARRASLILSGVAVSTLLNAGISCFTYADPDLLTAYSAFSVGGFAGVKLIQLWLPAVVVAGCLVLCLCLGDRLDLLCLGDTSARTLGVRVSGLRVVCLLCASAAAASVVSFAGLLGFVGLIVPHMARRLFGGGGEHRTRVLLLSSALLGATLCLAADLVGRVLAAPSEIPVGIMMSLLGAPFFLWLLLRRREISYEN